MALVKCKECGKEISDKSKKCNGCGAPTREANPKIKKRIIIGLLAVITLYIVGNVIYDKCFNYEMIPYCENGYDLENDRCIKILDTTEDFIGYDCPDNYESNNGDRCHLPSIEPVVTKVCHDGDSFKPTGYVDSITGEEVINCYGPVLAHGSRIYYIDSFYNPTEEYSCPNGYLLKNKTCVREDLAKLEYYTTGTPICPNGYELTSTLHNVKARDAIQCANGTCYNSNKNKPNNHLLPAYKQVCVKKDIQVPKYKKVKN